MQITRVETVLEAQFRPVAYAQRIGWRWGVFFAVAEQDDRTDIGVRFWLKRSAVACAQAIDRAFDAGSSAAYYAEDMS